MASRNASRTVVSVKEVPSGMLGSDKTAAFGASTSSPVSSVFIPSPESAGSSVAWPPASPLASTLAASSPSSASTAMTALTFTPSVPSGMRILAKTPSSTASTSIVALSVSISAMMSPEETVSPSCFNHFDNVPSSMVGDRAGMRISTDINVLRKTGWRTVEVLSFLASGDLDVFQDVSPEFGWIGLRALKRIVGGFLDDALDLFVDILEFVFACMTQFKKLALQALDWIVVRSDVVDFFPFPVFGRVRHGVAAIPISLHFQYVRTFSGTSIFDGFFACFAHSHDIHAIDFLAFDFE
mmetsp:Transcript_35447/g.90545  ORF Transcript_35447/g.90545 Transcript_35447/m.90545 type:complete len:297 (-) Transcript_35447:635-1525(-)